MNKKYEKTKFEGLSANELNLRSTHIIKTLDSGNLSKKNIKLLETTFKQLIKRYMLIAVNDSVMLKVKPKLRNRKLWN